MSKQLKRDRD